VRDEELLFRLIRASFQQRRKTLKNSLSGIVPEGIIGDFSIAAVWIPEFGRSGYRWTILAR
jgi:16S rRNA A1518/A1519 N6-dimethyltransferase RsmA/KsgA/DIM1 with predicted DNA glycosylase/AP lyase activity